MRFANRPLPKLDFLSDNAYGLYLVHYVFVVWLQYLLLGAALIAILKAMLVFAGTLVLSSAVLAAVGRLPAAGRIIGTARTVAQKTN
jgi:surface polysaccharide O-acyltransferase-like enzyme